MTIRRDRRESSQLGIFVHDSSAGAWGHVACFTAALGFMFIWPMLAVRDSFDLGHLLTPEVSAAAYCILWLISGALGAMYSAKSPIRISGIGFAGWAMFTGLWYLNVAFLGISLPHESLYPLNCLVWCVAPFIVGTLLPRNYLTALPLHLGMLSVLLCSLLAVIYITDPGARVVSRNNQFISINPITQAAHVSVGLLYLLVRRKLSIPLVLRMILVGISIWQIVLSGSRGPTLALVGALVWTIAGTSAMTRGQRFGIGGVLAVSIFGVLTFQEYLPDEIRSRFIDVDHSLNASGEQGGAMVRSDPIQEALRLGMEQPIFGSGLSLNIQIGFYSHNLFSQAFLETGIIGVFGIFMTIISALRGYLRQGSKGCNESQFLGTLFVFFCILHQFSFTAIVAVQFWFLAGIGIRLLGKSEKTAGVRPRVLL